MITEEHPATAMGNLEDAPHARAAGQHGREYKAQRPWACAEHHGAESRSAAGHARRRRHRGSVKGLL